MSKQERILIVLASDNHYAILIAALIKSIEENHQTKELLDFYIIDDGISEKNKAKIQASVNPSVSTVRWFRSTEVIPPTVQLPIDSSAFPLTVYMRLFAPYIVPKEADKLLYLDVDMIVLEDISKLWHTNLGENLFGAVQDWQETVSKHSWGGIPNYKELGIPPETKYFNTGLLLIKPKQWREAGITQKIIQCMNDNMKYSNLPDQYGANIVLRDQWYQLDTRWNWPVMFEKDNPYILHFLDVKPIFTSYKSNKHYQDTFYKYLELTSWRGFKPVSGNKRLVQKLYNKSKKLSLRYLRPILNLF